MLEILTNDGQLQNIFLLCHGTNELVLYFTSYRVLVEKRSGVYGFYRDCEGGDLVQSLINNSRNEQDFLKVNCDCMSVIYLAKNQVYHARMNHIDVRYHFVWDVLEDGDIELKKIHTKNNPANVLTKVVLRVKFNHCENLYRILPVG